MSWHVPHSHPPVIPSTANFAREPPSCRRLQSTTPPWVVGWIYHSPPAHTQMLPRQLAVHGATCMGPGSCAGGKLYWRDHDRWIWYMLMQVVQWHYICQSYNFASFIDRFFVWCYMLFNPPCIVWTWHAWYTVSDATGVNGFMSLGLWDASSWAPWPSGVCMY